MLFLIVRQVVEKAIEYGKPAYMCFINLTKAFDRVNLLSDVVDILQRKHVPKTIIDIIRHLNHNTSTHILVHQNLTEEIKTPTGIRQGDSLSPQLFNQILDEIIKYVKSVQGGYSLTMGEIIAENEDDLQPLLYAFYEKAKYFNMQISTTDIRHECEIEDIVRWGRKRRRAWNDHVDRMARERLAKIARDGVPRTRRDAP